MSENNNNQWSRRGFLAGIGATAALAAGCGVRETEPESEVLQWDIEADVVVAGSGAAGTCAALEARAAGAQTLVLERLPKLGGSSAMSGGVIYLGGGTPLQKACGFEDTPEAMYDYIVAASALHPQLDKVRLYCEESIEHFHWLVKRGVNYKASFTEEKGLPSTDDSLYYSGSELTWPYRDLARPAPRGHVPSNTSWTGGRELLMNTLIPAAQKAGVKFLTEVIGERLIQASDGRVLGLVAEYQGERKRIRARRGVVLACGGFIHNREMVKLYAPELYECSVPWGNMGDLGDGIRMGLGAGGVGVRMNQGFAILPLYQPTHVLKGIVVNRFGQRFVPEDTYHAFVGNQIAFHQGGQAWLITDANSQYGYEDYRVVEAARANSIAELEAQLFLPPQSLTGSVDYYNRFAVKREDPMFHKHPDYLAALVKAPFVAYDLSPRNAFFAAHTFGGLHTNTDAQVLNARNEPVPGLYAAGRTSWGLPSAPYLASGISVGDCSFFGRRAGRHAAGQNV